MLRIEQLDPILRTLRARSAIRSKCFARDPMARSNSIASISPSVFRFASSSSVAWRRRSSRPDHPSEHAQQEDEGTADAEVPSPPTCERV